MIACRARTFSSTASESRLKRWAMGRMRSGRKVPSVSMKATLPAPPPISVGICMVKSALDIHIHFEALRGIIVLAQHLSNRCGVMLQAVELKTSACRPKDITASVSAHLSGDAQREADLCLASPTSRGIRAVSVTSRQVKCMWHVQRGSAGRQGGAPVLSEDLGDGPGLDAATQQLIHSLCAGGDLDDIPLTLQAQMPVQTDQSNSSFRATMVCRQSTVTIVCDAK